MILTAEEAPQICSNQVVIEIKQCALLPHQEVLAALFNEMVVSLRNERGISADTPYQESVPFCPFCTVVADAAIP